MRVMLSFGRYVILLAIAIVLTAYCSAYLFVPVYEALFPSHVGGFGDIDYKNAALLFVAVQFYIPLFFVSIGDERRYWAFAVVLIMLGLIDYQVDPGSFGILLSIVLAGGIIGWFIRFIATRTLGKMPAMEGMKKYF